MDLWLKTDCICCGGLGVVEKINPEAIRQHRKYILKMSLRKTALSIGVSAAYLSDVELGRRNPNAAVLKYYGIQKEQ